MKEQRVSKITISLPQALLSFADRLAREGSTSRSEVFASLLTKEEEARTQALMAEGYGRLAGENRREAEEALDLTSEVVLSDD